jgi:hypothetical protein
VAEIPKYARAEFEKNLDMRINLAANAIKDLFKAADVGLADQVYVLEMVKFDLLRSSYDQRVYGDTRN